VNRYSVVRLLRYACSQCSKSSAHSLGLEVVEFPPPLNAPVDGWAGTEFPAAFRVELAIVTIVLIIPTDT
jgi:hypothetical protein